MQEQEVFISYSGFGMLLEFSNGFREVFPLNSGDNIVILY